MTATELPVRERRARAARPFPVPWGRLLWLELRHNPMPWTFPLLAALFAFDPFRTAMDYPAVWYVRASVLPNKMLPDFVLFVVGIAAWMGARDGRRRTLDLVTATPRPRWAAQLASWAATTIWALAGFLAGTAVLYGVTATQATWGGPPWWPVIVSCAELAVLAALGYVAGALFPGRFTAPLAAVAAFLLCLEGFRNAVGQSSSLAVLSPTTYVPPNDTGVFYAYPPDVAIDQVLFLAGLLAVALSLLGLARRPGTGPGLRRAAAIITAAGTAAVVMAVVLASTARQVIPGAAPSHASSAAAPPGIQGEWIIPALHDAASGHPLPYTPVCQSVVTVPVCTHPAFRVLLPDVTAALRPLLREIEGLPGAPARVGQVPSGTLVPPHRGQDISVGTPSGALAGSPPVFEYTADRAPAGAFGITRGMFEASLQGSLVAAFLPDGASSQARRHGGSRGHGVPGEGPAGTAQPPAVLARMAVQAALLLRAGMSLTTQAGPSGAATVPIPAAQQAQVNAAARRLAAMPAAGWHAWLATHLAALRAGHLTLARLP